MDIKEIMSIDVSNLKKKQKKVLEEHVCKVLMDTMALIKKGDYDKVRECLAFSPSGDGYGSDNYYIDFGYGEKSLDMDEILYKLEMLK